MAANKKKGKKGKKGAEYVMPSGPVMAVRESAVLEAPARVRKNMDIDVEALATARKALGAKTDTEAVNRALAEVARNADILTAFDAWVNVDGVDDAFGHLTA